MGLPPKQGLYDPRNEHDACGVGFVANIKGAKVHEIITRGLEILINLDHRGAVGADPLVGDGAGILIQIPDALLREWAKGAAVSPCRSRATTPWPCASCRATPRRARSRSSSSSISSRSKARCCWAGAMCRPTTSGLGKTVLDAMPVIRQAFIGRGAESADQDAFERKLLAIRKQTQNPLAGLADKHKLPALTELYMPSLLHPHRGLQGPAARPIRWAASTTTCRTR